MELLMDGAAESQGEGHLVKYMYLLFSISCLVQYRPGSFKLTFANT